LIGRLRNNDMSDGRTPVDVARMFFFVVDRVLQRESAKLHGVTIFHDLRGLSRNNIDIRIPKLIFKGLFGTIPIQIKAVYLLNAPGFFKAIFKVLSMAFPSKMRARIHFIDDISDIYEVIDKDSLFEEHGGKSDHDTAKWVANLAEQEKNEPIDSLYYCLQKTSD